MAMLVHAVMNASTEIWKALPEYSGSRMSAGDAAAATMHVNFMVAIVLWVAAAAVVLVYGPLNLSPRANRTDRRVT